MGSAGAVLQGITVRRTVIGPAVSMLLSSKPAGGGVTLLPRRVPDPLTESESRPEDVADNSSDDVPLDLYRRLHDIAHRLMRGEAVGHTLQTTALVHEGYMRLIRTDPTLVDSPGRLLAAASESMRNALIDHARGRQRLKRGGDRQRELIDLTDLPRFLDADPDQVVALEDALDVLAAEDELAARVVQMRFHLGLSVEEAARALEVSPRTVKRRWAFARTWLFRQLAGEADGGEGAS